MLPNEGISLDTEFDDSIKEAHSKMDDKKENIATVTTVVDETKEEELEDGEIEETEKGASKSYEMPVEKTKIKRLQMDDHILPSTDIKNGKQEEKIEYLCDGPDTKLLNGSRNDRKQKLKIGHTNGQYYDRDARQWIVKDSHLVEAYQHKRELISYGDTCFIEIDVVRDEEEDPRTQTENREESAEVNQEIHASIEDMRICKIKGGYEGEDLRHFLTSRKNGEAKSENETQGTVAIDRDENIRKRTRDSVVKTRSKHQRSKRCRENQSQQRKSNMSSDDRVRNTKHGFTGSTNRNRRSEREFRRKATTKKELTALRSRTPLHVRNKESPYQSRKRRVEVEDDYFSANSKRFCSKERKISLSPFYTERRSESPFENKDSNNDDTSNFANMMDAMNYRETKGREEQRGFHRGLNIQSGRRPGVDYSIDNEEDKHYEYENSSRRDQREKDVGQCGAVLFEDDVPVQRNRHTKPRGHRLDKTSPKYTFTDRIRLSSPDRERANVGDRERCREFSPDRDRIRETTLNKNQNWKSKSSADRIREAALNMGRIRESTFNTNLIHESIMKRDRSREPTLNTDNSRNPTQNTDGRRTSTHNKDSTHEYRRKRDLSPVSKINMNCRRDSPLHWNRSRESTPNNDSTCDSRRHCDFTPASVINTDRGRDFTSHRDLSQDSISNTDRIRDSIFNNGRILDSTPNTDRIRESSPYRNRSQDYILNTNRIQDSILNTDRIRESTFNSGQSRDSTPNMARSRESSPYRNRSQDYILNTNRIQEFTLNKDHIRESTLNRNCSRKSTRNTNRSQDLSPVSTANWGSSRESTLESQGSLGSTSNRDHSWKSENNWDRSRETTPNCDQYLLSTGPVFRDNDEVCSQRKQLNDRGADRKRPCGSNNDVRMSPHPLEIDIYDRTGMQREGARFRHYETEGDQTSDLNMLNAGNRREDVCNGQDRQGQNRVASKALTIKYLEEQPEELRKNVATKIYRALVAETFNNIPAATVCSYLKHDDDGNVVFDKEDDLLNLIEQYNDKFVVRYVFGKELISVKTDIQICPDYTENQHKQHSCTDLHICKYFLLNDCSSRNCKFSHDLNTPHNRKVLEVKGLDDMDIDCIKSVMQKFDSRNISTTPLICKFYNNQGGCRQKDKCTFLHLCSHFINDNCTFGSDCKRSHDFRDEQPLAVLNRYGIIPDLNDDAKIVGLIKETLDGDKIKLKRDLTTITANGKSTLRGENDATWDAGKTRHRLSPAKNSHIDKEENDMEYDSVESSTATYSSDDSDYGLSRQPDFIPLNSKSSGRDLQKKY